MYAFWPVRYASHVVRLAPHEALSLHELLLVYTYTLADLREKEKSVQHEALRTLVTRTRALLEKHIREIVALLQTSHVS
ncbi:MAG: hypothetical protein KM296_04450 [Brockia lithotrophica]|nr:hypothetical protein [Brockia lithotrophica]